jgi:hypothetical protein
VARLTRRAHRQMQRSDMMTLAFEQIEHAPKAVY